MALNARQTRYYTDTVSIYRGAFGAVDATKKTVVDVSYTLLAATVKCKLVTTPIADEHSTVGRTEITNLFTYDKVHFDAAQDIGAGDFLLFTASGNSGITDKWWVVEGDEQIKYASGGRRANYKMVYAKYSPKAPPGYAPVD